MKTPAQVEEAEHLITTLLKKCPNMRILRQIHSYVLKSHLPSISKTYLLSQTLAFCALSPSGNIHHARTLFSQIQNPNIFSYNSMIRATSQTPTPSKEPITLYYSLTKRGYPNPNSYTLAFVLKACAIILAFKEGLQIHAHVMKLGLGSSPFVQTALVNFYAKCEEIRAARRVFDEIPVRNLIAWSTMISGYAKMRLVNECLGLFREMQKEGVKPDEVTMVSVITACASSGALDLGRWVHAFVDKNVVNINVDIELTTAMINMYARCGCIEKAKELFDGMVARDTKAWSSMIVGLAIHGLAEDALDVFKCMLEDNVRPNHVTFVGVLSACAHRGMVSEGRRYWSCMVEFGIEPVMEHYGCMVDLLCRCGLVEEAYGFVERMHIAPNSIIWRTLLMGCKKKGMLEKGEYVAQCLFELEPLNPENYVLLSNMYAANSMWEEVSVVRKKMKENAIKALPGCSSIEIDGFVHEFVVSDRSHPEAKEIREVLQDIAERVERAGHKPWTSSVLHDVGDEEKEGALCEHSERLAIAYGLLKTKAPTVIRVVKNLRACPDCHEVIKIVSKLYGREIIVRDRVRFHRFADGVCSCKDFW